MVAELALWEFTVMLSVTTRMVACTRGNGQRRPAGPRWNSHDRKVVDHEPAYRQGPKGRYLD